MLVGFFRALEQRILHRNPNYHRQIGSIVFDLDTEAERWQRRFYGNEAEYADPPGLYSNEETPDDQHLEDSWNDVDDPDRAELVRDHQEHLERRFNARMYRRDDDQESDRDEVL